MNRIYSEATYNAMVNATINKFFYIHHIHKIFVHSVFETLKNEAKIHNLKMFGNVEVCETALSQMRNKKA
jgi:hypothetical protein